MEYSLRLNVITVSSLQLLTVKNPGQNAKRPRTKFQAKTNESSAVDLAILD